MQHLDELRVRLIRVVIYAALAGIISWYWLYDPMLQALSAPLNRVLHEKGVIGGLVFQSITEPFFLKLKVCSILALVIASPMILLEAWGFISPGLHAHERRPFRLVFPMTIVLFCMGAGLSYYILPAAFTWFLSYLPSGMTFLPRLSEYILFVVKMCAAFGAGFELPVILMFLGKIGLIRHTLMKQYWRHAVVLIMLAAAILTPSNDPFSMLMMAVPMAILYLGSISLVKWVQPPLELVDYSSDEDAPASRAIPVDPNEED